MRAKHGHLEPHYFVTCAKCDCEQETGQRQKSLATVALRNLGWRYRYEHGGWLCPGHVKDYPLQPRRAERS